MDSQWRKSTRSGSNGACVEVRFADHTVEVRDSKDRSGRTLRFDGSTWLTFLAQLKR
ncbi:DUF397 domain-containing protein [Micromonospora sp. BQ11]|uniref:DUF397 domain-containing protein n=1 Tax=Micromonospora sp. BQ11 TaxID=3452212 RepID=UPI003F89A80F